jgi:steroid delta-isomerase-like uncharacterized protein
MFRTFQNIYQFLNTDVADLWALAQKGDSSVAIDQNLIPTLLPTMVKASSSETPPDPNSPEGRKAIAIRYYQEIMNEANLNTIDELMSEDFVFTLPTHPDPYYGPAGFKDLVTMLHGAFPDVHLDVQHLLVDGDTVVGHWIGSGTHTGGPLHTVKGDLPPNGRHFVIDGVSWLKIQDGKITASLANEDTLSLLLQLGIIPSQQLDTKTLADRYFSDLLNAGNLEAVDEILAVDCALWHPFLPEPVFGRDQFRRFAQMLKGSFPDGKYTVEYSMNDGTMAARRWIFEGTHSGEFLTHPASHKVVKFQGVHIFKAVGGKIKEVWVNENAMALLDQIGAIPAPPAEPKATVKLLNSNQATIQTWRFEQPLVKIGRERDNDIQIEAPEVSRHHCTLEFVDSQWQLTSHGKNGTYVNGKLVETMRLPEDTVMRLGNEPNGVLLRFQAKLEPPIQDEDEADPMATIVR